MAGKFLQGAISRGLREAGGSIQESAGVLEVRSDTKIELDFEL